LILNSKIIISRNDQSIQQGFIENKIAMLSVDNPSKSSFWGEHILQKYCANQDGRESN